MHDKNHFVSKISKDSVRRAIALLGIKPSDVHSCHRNSEKMARTLHQSKSIPNYKKGGVVTKISIKIIPKSSKKPPSANCFKKGGPIYKMKTPLSMKPLKKVPGISDKIRKHEANSSKGYFKFLRDI